MRPSFEGSVNTDVEQVSTKLITWEKKSHVVRLAEDLDEGSHKNKIIVREKHFHFLISRNYFRR